MAKQSKQARTRPDRAAWRSIVAKYQKPDNRRSLWQVANTFIPLVLVWILMVMSLEISYWLTALFVVLTAGFTVRIFIIMHDCGHDSFTTSRRANEVLGFISGVVCFTPFYSWRYKHALHHATSGDLDRRQPGDIWMMTVAEYQAATPRTRWWYRIYRHPFSLFLFAPVFLFLVLYRVPLGDEKRRERRSVHFTNLALLVVVGAMSLLIGFKTFAILQIAVTILAAGSGVWLFYVQHQYEGTYWQKREDWDYATAAVEGSSFYKLPRVLQWFTGNIGYHHVHHLSPRIPNYNLEACHGEITMFNVTSITFRQSFQSLGLRLWDEDNNRLIGFRGLKALSAAPVQNFAGRETALTGQE